MTIDLASDLDLGMDELAVTITPAGGSAIQGFFDEPALIVGPDGAQVTTTEPVISCKTSDVSEVAKGSTVTITANAYLAVADGSYTVADKEPSGPGMTALFLQEA